MTDGNQDDTTQPLVEGHEGNENPVESEIQQDHAPVDNEQLKSGAPLNENQSNQEVSNIDEGESTIEDSLPQESAAKEDGESEQATESVKPVEQAESEPADDKPDENEDSSCDNKTASEIQEGEQIESGGVSEQQQDADKQKDVPSDEKEQCDVTPAGEADVGNTTSTTHTEQQGLDSLVTSGQEQQDSPVENEQQGIVAPSQDQQDSPAENEKGDKPVDGSVDQGIIEDQQPEEGQANGEVTKETPQDENSPDSETTLAASDKATEEAQQPDEASQNEAIKSEPNQTAPKVEIPVESPQAVQPEATVTVQGVIVPTDELQEENKKLKQDMFMMKQQEDAYRIKVLSLEQEVGKLRARKIDNRSQDSLASDSDSYLKQKLAETERELDTAERKVKDLQLRLKRFAKDDQIKDEKILQMEREVKELSDNTKKLEQSLADSKRESNNNATMQASSDKNDSKVCVIL